MKVCAASRWCNVCKKAPIGSLHLASSADCVVTERSMGLRYVALPLLWTQLRGTSGMKESPVTSLQFKKCSLLTEFVLDSIQPRYSTDSSRCADFLHSASVSVQRVLRRQQLFEVCRSWPNPIVHARCAVYRRFFQSVPHCMLIFRYHRCTFLRLSVVDGFQPISICLMVAPTI